MSTQHTPGPWKVVDGYYPSIKEVSGASFKISCVMSAIDLTEKDYQRRSADLRLVAAAPDLLEACKRARLAMAAASQDDATFRGEYLRLDAAIARATNT